MTAPRVEPVDLVHKRKERRARLYHLRHFTGSTEIGSSLIIIMHRYYVEVMAWECMVAVIWLFHYEQSRKSY
jgi:ribulose-5-phosphate 4-epimerase/fuculose-1-phosphate aldolase